MICHNLKKDLVLLEREEITHSEIYSKICRSLKKEIFQNQAPEYLKGLWATHLLNVKNRLDFIIFRQKKLNEEIHSHLKEHKSSHGK